MNIKRSSRMLVATFVVASLAASPALASGGPMDHRASATKGVSYPPPGTALAEPRSAEPAGPSTGAKAPLPGPPVFPTNTTPLPRPAAPVATTSSSNDFDWGSAGIGAAVAGGLALMFAGAFVMSRRRRVAAA